MASYVVAVHKVATPALTHLNYVWIFFIFYSLFSVCCFRGTIFIPCVYRFRRMQQFLKFSLPSYVTHFYLVIVRLLIFFHSYMRGKTSHITMLLPSNTHIHIIMCAHFHTKRLWTPEIELIQYEKEKNWNRLYYMVMLMLFGWVYVFFLRSCSLQRTTAYYIGIQCIFSSKMDRIIKMVCYNLHTYESGLSTER